jgi:hypothetical protein
VGIQSSYLSQNSPIEAFGLGTATVVDTLEIIWPTGKRQARTGIAARQRILVTEDEP